MTNETITRQGRRYRLRAGPWSDAFAPFDYIEMLVAHGEIASNEGAIVEGGCVYIYEGEDEHADTD